MRIIMVYLSARYMEFGRSAFQRDSRTFPVYLRVHASAAHAAELAASDDNRINFKRTAVARATDYCALTDEERTASSLARGDLRLDLRRELSPFRWPTVDTLCAD